MKLLESIIIFACALALCKSQLVKHVIQETDKTIKGISRVVTDRLFGGINFGLSAQASVSSQGDGSGEREPPRRPGLFGLSSLLHQHRHQDRAPPPPPGTHESPGFHYGGGGSFGLNNHNEFQYGGDHGNNQGGRNPQHNYQHSQDNYHNGYQGGGTYGNNQGGRNPQHNHQHSQENNQYGYQAGGNYNNNQGGGNPQHNYQHSQQNNHNGHDGGVDYGTNQGAHKPQPSQENNEQQTGESVKGDQQGNKGQRPPVMQVSHPPTETPKQVDKENKPTLVALPPDGYTYGADGIKVKEPAASGGDDEDFAIDIRTSFDEDKAKENKH